MSNILDAASCVEALNEARSKNGKPEFFNTDQGSQFSNFDFTGGLKDAEVTISMDGRSRCMDKHLHRTPLKLSQVRSIYLHELTDGFVAEWVIGSWIDFNNTRRPHSVHAGRTPAEAYASCTTNRTLDMMDKPNGLPTSPQAQQSQQNVINRFAQYHQELEYTLTWLPNCPSKWNQLSIEI